MLRDGDLSQLRLYGLELVGTYCLFSTKKEIRPVYGHEQQAFNPVLTSPLYSSSWPMIVCSAPPHKDIQHNKRFWRFPFLYVLVFADE